MSILKSNLFQPSKNFKLFLLLVFNKPNSSIVWIFNSIFLSASFINDSNLNSVNLSLLLEIRNLSQRTQYRNLLLCLFDYCFDLHVSEVVVHLKSEKWLLGFDCRTHWGVNFEHFSQIEKLKLKIERPWSLFILFLFDFSLLHHSLKYV